MTARLLHLDCDTGIDDALALTFLARSASTTLTGVSTVFGNTSAPQAAANTSALLHLLDADTEISIGERASLCGVFDGGASNVHGGNGIADVHLEQGPEAGTRPAAQRIVELAQAHGSSLNILAIGPLTNIARALEIDPGLPDRIGTLTVMGGAVWVPGNITPYAEANIYHDPEAAQIVLRAGFDLVLVPLDVTMDHYFDDTDIAAIRAASGPLSEALATMLDFYIAAYAVYTGVRRAPLHDPLAAAVATGDVEVVEKQTPLEVVLDGPERGQTRPAQSGPPVRVVTTADPIAAQVVRERLIAAKKVER